MITRTAIPTDLDALVNLEQRLFPEDAWPREQIRDNIVSPYANFIVSVDGDDIVGYAIGHFLPSNDVADIHNIAVVESHRGRGIGGALFDDLIEWSRERGASAMMLEVRADNTVAQSLYSSRGFHVIATRQNYYQPAGVDALVMRREVSA